MAPLHYLAENVDGDPKDHEEFSKIQSAIAAGLDALLAAGADPCPKEDAWPPDPIAYAMRPQNNRSLAVVDVFCSELMRRRPELADQGLLVHAKMASLPKTRTQCERAALLELIGPAGADGVGSLRI